MLKIFEELSFQSYTVFSILISRGIGASILIIFIILFRFLLKKAPKWTHCLLWLILAIYLICPIQITSPLSIYNLTSQICNVEVYYLNQPEKPELYIDFPALPGYPDNQMSGSEKIGVHTTDLYLPPIMEYFLLITATLLAYAFINYFLIRFKVREAVLIRDNIWLCDAVKSPFIYGIIKPRIYLPSSVEETHINYVLLHEQAHLKRKDHWWKPLGYLLLAAYWFNPLIWAAYVLFCQDIEFACDEKVIREFNIEKKKAYSYAMLSCSTQQTTVFSCPLAFGEIGVKERVKAVLDFKKPTFRILAAAIAICVITAMCFLTHPIEIDAKTENNVNYMQEM